MNRWSVETRNRVIVLTVVTVVVLVLMWLFLVGTLEESLKLRSEKMVVLREQLSVMREAIEKAEQYNDVIRRGGLVLGSYENQMAQGDLYRWMRKALLALQQRHDVTITTFPPPREGPLNAPPKVPYKAGTYSIAGTARYHDFGSFLADLENSSPFIRIKSLVLEATPTGIADAADEDNLSFRLEFVTLIKSTAPQR